MKFNNYLLLIFIFLIASLSYSQEPQWLRNMKKIVPLQSTQDDVIKLLGTPSNSVDPYSPRYINKDGKFLITYSEGLCEQNPQSIFNVAEYTVIEIAFFPKKPFKPSKYGISLKGLR